MYCALDRLIQECCRQNRGSMLPRDVGLLQVLPLARPQIPNTPAMGATGAGEDRLAGQERRGAGDATGNGCEPGVVRAGHP